MESYAIHQFINGVINVPQVLETLGGETAVQQVLMSLPAGKLFLAAYLGVMIIFLASHMDAVAYTMAATSTRNLQEGDDPDRGLRLFWCVVITLIPLSILFTGASLETMKTTVVLTALPFLVILLVKVGGFIRWLNRITPTFRLIKLNIISRRHRLKPWKKRQCSLRNRIQRRQLSAIILTIKVSL